MVFENTVELLYNIQRRFMRPVKKRRCRRTVVIAELQ